MGLLSKLFGAKATVRVSFINAEDGELIGSSNMEFDQLPESFETETTMTVEGDSWTVVEAEPVHAADFRKSGELSLKLKKIEQLSPQSILYSIPTIANEMPEVEELAPAAHQHHEEGVFTLHEDDWRQLEFLNPASRAVVDEECAAINQVREEASIPMDNFTGFSDCHTRSSIGLPNLSISLTELLEVTGQEIPGKLQFEGYESYIKNGFCIATDNTVFYGLENAGIVTELCIGNASEGTSQEIRSILERFDLLFVNWYHTQVITKES